MQPHTDADDGDAQTDQLKRDLADAVVHGDHDRADRLSRQLRGRESKMRVGDHVEAEYEAGTLEGIVDRVDWTAGAGVTNYIVMDNEGDLHALMHTEDDQWQLCWETTEAVERLTVNGTDLYEALDSQTDSKALDELVTALDRELESAIFDNGEDERDALIDALDSADRDTEGEWGPDEDGVLHHDGDWAVITSDWRILDRYLGEVEGFDRDVAIDLLQAAHDRVAAEVSGDPNIAADVDVFVYRCD